MFSNIVTAARGLFMRQESQGAHSDFTDTSAAITPNMVADTERVTAAPKETTSELKANGVAKHGKRKAQPIIADKTSDKQNKRRKRSSLEAAGATNDGANDSSHVMEEDSGKEQSLPTKHFRFNSEEPTMPVPETQPEKISQPPNQNGENSEEDSDDDAPETILNSTQLLKSKEQAKKHGKLRQLEDHLKKEKRRKLDERWKLQAKSRAKEIPAIRDDAQSDSTSTLQASTTQDVTRRALPALLPDDILNAEPVPRPPTPPAETKIVASKKSNKLRFLEKTEKAPKDIQMGDVTIRVLDAPSSKRDSKPALAPKASKSGRNVKENWLKRERSTAYVNGLRRTKGGPPGFIRR